MVQIAKRLCRRERGDSLRAIVADLAARAYFESARHFVRRAASRNAS